MTTRLDTLRTLAENTDGLAIVNTNDLGKGMRRIVDDVSAYYLLGYYSTNTRNDGRYRSIDVKMKPPGLVDARPARVLRPGRERGQRVRRSPDRRQAARHGSGRRARRRHSDRSRG